MCNNLSKIYLGVIGKKTEITGGFRKYTFQT